jgi:hypothetical protein
VPSAFTENVSFLHILSPRWVREGGGREVDDPRMKRGRQPASREGQEKEAEGSPRTRRERRIDATDVTRCDEYECICFMEYGGAGCLYAVSVLRDKTIIGVLQFTCDQCWSVDKLRGCRRDDGGTVTEADESECRFRGARVASGTWRSTRVR